ncbi:phage terminase large subunit [Eisenbergiella porci]|uniref:phage terminase large subunit n=1 Tax=Eisenbergiella porci TaxID=2652274 RepID=UPI002A80FE28|nr:phage terminase large subunit [Eisenbergiella porci]
MIDLEEYLRELEEEDDQEQKDNVAYQENLFAEYVLRKKDRIDERQKLEKRFAAGEPVTGEKGLRKELAAFDLAYFGRAYLPHYFTRKSPAFHEELDELWSSGVMKGKNPFRDAKEIARLDGSQQAIAAPRGHAKTTNFTFKDTLHAVLYQYKHYPILLSDSSEQAEGFLDDIKTELEDNPHILEDFGILKGDKVWRSSVILTKTGIKLEAIGSGKKIRGRRHRNWRPDLLVLDDIENDENVNTPEQRKKLKSWFDKAVSKAGDTYTDIMYIGTILHYDSLLSRVLVNPTYRTKKYRAVLSFATNTALWEEWERIYTNLFDEDHEANAWTFFQANEKEMLEGTQVLWEEKNPYYKLMQKRLSEGEASFNSELQNDPIDPENADFSEEWLDYYEPELMDFSKPNFLLVGANDPSLGKNKKADTSTIIDLALDLNTGYMYVLGASVEKRKPDVIIDDVIETHRRYKRDLKKGYYKFGVETVQFQYFFKDVMAAKALEAGEYIPIEEIQSIANKELRIRSLQPFVKNKWIKFNRNHKELIKQLTEFPMGANDDAPDGLQMAVSLAQSVRATASRPEYKTVQRRRSNFRKGAW